MAGEIKSLRLKRTATAGKVPTTAQILEGELALNLADKKIFTRHGNNIITLGGIVDNKHTGNLTIDGKLQVNGEIHIKSIDSLRFLGDVGTRSVFHRLYSDKTYYMLVSDTKTGSYNALRPFAFDITTGKVTMENGVLIKGGLEVSSGTLTCTGNANFNGTTNVNGEFRVKGAAINTKATSATENARLRFENDDGVERALMWADKDSTLHWRIKSDGNTQMNLVAGGKLDVYQLQVRNNAVLKGTNTIEGATTFTAGVNLGGSGRAINTFRIDADSASANTHLQFRDHQGNEKGLLYTSTDGGMHLIPKGDHGAAVRAYTDGNFEVKRLTARGGMSNHIAIHCQGVINIERQHGMLGSAIGIHNGVEDNGTIWNNLLYVTAAGLNGTIGFREVPGQWHGFQFYTSGGDFTIRSGGEVHTNGSMVGKYIRAGNGTATLHPDGNVEGSIWGGYLSNTVRTKVHDVRRGPQQLHGRQGEPAVWEIHHGYLTGYQNHTSDGNIKFSNWYFRVPQAWSDHRGWFEFQNQ